MFIKIICCSIHCLFNLLLHVPCARQHAYYLSIKCINELFEQKLIQFSVFDIPGIRLFRPRNTILMLNCFILESMIVQKRLFDW